MTISSVMSGKVGGGDITPPTFTDLKSIVAATKAHNIISGGDGFPAKNLAEKMIFGKQSKLPTHVHKAVLSLMDKIPSDILSSIISDGKYGDTKDKIAENITLESLYVSQSSLEKLLMKHVVGQADRHINASTISSELQPVTTDSIMNSFDKIIRDSIDAKLSAFATAINKQTTMGEMLIKQQQEHQAKKLKNQEQFKSQSGESAGEPTSQFSNEISGEEPTGELTGELDLTSDIPEQLFQTPEMGELIGELSTGEDVVDSITNVLDDFKGEPSDFLAGESSSAAGEIATDQLGEVGEDIEGEMSDSLADLGEQIGESIAEEIGELVA